MLRIRRPSQECRESARPNISAYSSVTLSSELIFGSDGFVGMLGSEGLALEE